jgi:hypothetical protein
MLWLVLVLSDEVPIFLPTRKKPLQPFRRKAISTANGKARILLRKYRQKTAILQPHIAMKDFPATTCRIKKFRLPDK